MKKRNLLSSVLLMLALGGCETLAPVAVKQVEFPSPPKSAMTPPVISDYLTPWTALRQELDDSLSKQKSKPAN